MRGALIPFPSCFALSGLLFIAAIPLPRALPWAVFSGPFRAVPFAKSRKPRGFRSGHNVRILMRLPWGQTPLDLRYAPSDMDLRSRFALSSMSRNRALRFTEARPVSRVSGAPDIEARLRLKSAFPSATLGTRSTGKK